MTSAPDHRTRRPWSLQTRLMVTVIGMVALILVAVALATGTILGQILQQNLNNHVADTADRARLAVAASGFTGPTSAYQLVANGFQPGTLLIVQAPDGTTDGAYLDEDGDAHHLTTVELTQLTGQLTNNAAYQTTHISGVGTFRVEGVVAPNHYLMVVGLPLSEVDATIAQILTTVALVTAGGLLLLGVAIAFIIRRGLQPLRAVAATATRVAAMPMAEGAVSISERVPDAEADERTEIGRVGAALNTLLDHVGESLQARQRNEERMRAFVADASHELRTPLASIRGYSELSLRALRQAQGTGARQAQGTGARQAQGTGAGQAQGTGAGEHTEQALERIQAQSLRMTTLVEDLLLLARLDEGQELVYGNVDLTRVAVESVGDARPAGPEHNWVIDVGDEPVLISGDAARMHQVVANLLANARTHTPAGTTVTVSVRAEGHDAVLRVHDDGPGVDPQVADELFERFARADRSRARKTGGTGLGLSIAKAIVDAHHGTITVDSRPGDTTFTVRVPALPAPPPAPAAPEMTPEAVAADVDR